MRITVVMWISASFRSKLERLGFEIVHASEFDNVRARQGLYTRVFACGGEVGEVGGEVGEVGEVGEFVVRAKVSV